MAELASLSGGQQWRKYTGGAAPRSVGFHMLFFIAALLPILLRLRLVRFGSKPLHIPRVIRTTRAKRDDVVDLVSRAFPLCLAGGGARVQLSEFGFCLGAALLGGAGIGREEENQKNGEQVFEHSGILPQGQDKTPRAPRSFCRNRQKDHSSSPPT